MTQPQDHTLTVPGATLTYDVRTAEATTDPILLLIGSPMGADGFAALAERFPDRTVVTYDPRGVNRSTRDTEGETSPDEHAADLSSIIAEVAGGAKVDIFASSGGAVNALALVAKHPEQVRTLVAHEPPAAQALPDREAALQASRDIRDTYDKQGFGPAMAKFIALVGYQGDLSGFNELPAADPAMFGLPTEDDGNRNDALLGQNLITCTHYQHDFDALRAASTRIVPAVGVESAGQMAYRGGVAVAELLGTKPVEFPSHHGGFLGPSDFGMSGDPDGFAVVLRRVLDES